MPTMHFTFDDIAYTLHDLCQTRYASVFDQPFLGALREIHRQCGAVFTLFCFNRMGSIPDYDIARLPDCYREELQAETAWLRWGFHAQDDTTKYAADTGAGEAIARCNAALARFAGQESIDPILRLGFCSGSLENMLAVHRHGVRGLYGADDARLNYYLNQTQNDELLRTGRYDDIDHGLIFLRSLPRLDKRTAQDVIAALETWPQPLAAVFMHEYSFLAEPEAYSTYLMAIAQWGSMHGYDHGFHSDVLFGGKQA